MNLSERINKKEADFLKKHAISIDIEDIECIKPIPNRIIEILEEKDISPLLSEEDIKKMNLRDEGHWFNILRNKEGMKFMGEEATMFPIADWLNVELCDMYGVCFQKSNGNKNADCGNCKSSKRWG